jgi:hypothetical protein
LRWHSPGKNRRIAGLTGIDAASFGFIVTMRVQYFPYEFYSSAEEVTRAKWRFSEGNIDHQVMKLGSEIPSLNGGFNPNQRYGSVSWLSIVDAPILEKEEKEK